MRRPRRRAVVALSLVLVCLILVSLPIAPKVWERINIEIKEGSSPGLRRDGVFIPGRPCRYTVKKWGPLAGKPHGKVISWYPNGVVASRAFNVNGKNHGIVWLWDEAGAIVYQQRWVHGECEETRYEPPWFTEAEIEAANPRMWIPEPPPL